MAADRIVGAVIRVVIAYEDFAAANRARIVCHQFAEIAGLDTLGKPELWKFDLLKLPSMRAMATLETRNCDLVVLAPQQAGMLPSFVEEWMRQLFQAPPEQPKALVVLMGLTPQSHEAWAAMNHPLKELALRNQIPCWLLEPERPATAWGELCYDLGDLEAVVQGLFPRN